MLRIISFLAILVLIAILFPTIVDARAMFQQQASAVTDGTTGPDKDAAGIYVPPRGYSWLHTGQIGATVTNYGTYGRAYISNPICDGETCPSFVSPENSGIEYLFGGAVWIGGIVGNDTLVSVAADGWTTGISELLPPVPPESFSGLGDQSAWMLFTDTITDPFLTGMDQVDNRPHIPLNVRIANRAYAWNSDPENQTIIYDMVITNIGDQTINDGFIAFFLDGDVYHSSNESGGYTDDIAGSIRDAGIGYIIDNDGDPTGGVFTETSPTRLLAFKPLISSFATIDTNFNWWISNGNPTLDYGPQPVDEYGNPQCDFGGHLGTPSGDRSKYCMMSHPGWDFDQIYTADSIPGWAYPATYNQAVDFADGYDTRFLMSFGPFTLLPDSSVRILYTTFTGDSVLRDPDNLANLPDDPDQYLANLDFSHVLTNATVADSLAESLIDPLDPAVGLYAPYNDLDSVVLEWDPWGFGDIDGYEIYLYEIPADSLPYPGVVPPWIQPSAADLAASVGRVYQHAFIGLAPYGMYVASVANRTTARGIGAMGQSLPIQAGGRPPAPQVASEYAFHQDWGEMPELEWTPPEGLTVDHYNIYKFANPEEAQQKYYPHYDTDEFASEVPPRDSFFVDGVWYYFYGMEPYAQVDAGTTTFSEYSPDSTVYVVTAVTTSGLETAFSSDVTVFEVPPRTRDILVLLCALPSLQFVYCDSIVDYYDDLLGGYDFDLYNWRDTALAYFGDGRCKPDWWLDLMPYKMVIIDGALRFDVLNDPYSDNCPIQPGIEKYVWSQGVLAYFGSFKSIENIYASQPPGYYRIRNGFVTEGFGVDSMFTTGCSYYLHNPDYETDSLGGFIEADAVVASMPDLDFDPSRNPYRVPGIWPDSTGPMAAAFFNNDHAVPIHIYRSKYPSTSMAEGFPVGIRSDSYPSPVYTFGFRPWYMQRDDMSALIDYMMSPTSETVSAEAAIEPDTMDFLWAYAIDPISATIDIGHFSIEYTAGDVDQSTLRINTSVIPSDITIVDVHPNFTGPVLALTVPVRDFLLSYGPLWDRQVHPYSISATMTDGTSFMTTGSVFINGFLRGDANGDGDVNVSDVTFLVEFIFRGGQTPAFETMADANGDCRVDIGDAIYLINYIFKGGPAPQPGCAK